MIQKFFVLTVFTLFSGAACQIQNSSANVNNASNSVTHNAANLTAKNAAASPQNAENAAAQTINFDAPDGAPIVGTFFATAQADSPVVLMLH